MRIAYVVGAGPNFVKMTTVISAGNASETRSARTQPTTALRTSGTSRARRPAPFRAPDHPERGPSTDPDYVNVNGNVTDNGSELVANVAFCKPAVSSLVTVLILNVTWSPGATEVLVTRVTLLVPVRVGVV